MKTMSPITTALISIGRGWRSRHLRHRVDRSTITDANGWQRSSRDLSTHHAPLVGSVSGEGTAQAALVDDPEEPSVDDDVDDVEAADDSVDPVVDVDEDDALDELDDEELEPPRLSVL